MMTTLKRGNYQLYRTEDLDLGKVPEKDRHHKYILFIRYEYSIHIEEIS